MHTKLQRKFKQISKKQKIFILTDKWTMKSWFHDTSFIQNWSDRRFLSSQALHFYSPFLEPVDVMHNDVKECFRGSDVLKPLGRLNLDLALDPVLLLCSSLLELLAVNLDLSLTSNPILPFGTCYVIMHEVYLYFPWRFLKPRFYCTQQGSPKNNAFQQIDKTCRLLNLQVNAGDILKA